MKVTVYISKKDFDSFFRWIKQLELGILSSPPVNFSHLENDIQDPLKVSLDTHVYYLITDAQEDLKQIDSSIGPFSIDYEPDSEEYHLQVIKEGLRKAKREDLELELVYSALAIMRDLPNITPSEAIIIAEKTLLGPS